jgi:hypothetical protein
MRGHRTAVSALLSAALATVTLGAAPLVTATPAAAAITGHDEMVYAFGSARFYGSTQHRALARPVVGMANTAGGSAYWLVAEDGGVFSFGGAPYYGGLSGFPLRAPVAGITATPTGHGYWLVTQDGAVFPFGDAHYYGGMQGRRLNARIRSLTAAPNGTGYWLFASDGGVFTFGSAHFYGSTGNKRLNKPVVGMAANPAGTGYWLVASDGGVFTFGGARFWGSAGRIHLRQPVVGIARTGTGHGYWLGAADGGVFTYGDARFKGSAAGLVPRNRHVVTLAGMPTGDGYRMLALRDVTDVSLMSRGATGSIVSYLQLRLMRLGYWLPGINGVFDDLTQQAVYAFQKYQRLPRTGMVDAATQAAFRTATRPRPRSTTRYVVEIDKTRQILMITNGGVGIWTFNASSGSDRPYVENGTSGDAHTPEGVFSVIREVNGPDKSPLGSLWRPKYFTWQGHAIHGYTSVPPYPASHGCVRVSNTAMNWMWATNVLPRGTTVWVY